MKTTEQALKDIQDSLVGKGKVYVVTAYRVTPYTAKHRDWFYLNAAGDLRVKHGRGSVCLMGVAGTLFANIQIVKG